MSVWHRSTEEGSVAAPQAQPSFGGGPPPLLPPTHGQRRFNFLIVGVTILLAAGLVAGLVLSNGHRSKPSPVDSTKSAVHQAFLAYYSAVEQSYKQLDLTPLHPFVTTDGLKQEQGHMDAAVKSGARYQFTADHDLQVAVYSDHQHASIDDILVRHTVELDPASMAPKSAATTDTLHASYALQRQGDRWLVDSVKGFGEATATTDLPVSYAAASRDRPLAGAVWTEVEQAYLGYVQVSTKAFQNMDPTLLSSVETDPELSTEQSAIQKWKQQGLSYHYTVEHNYRIAMRDDDTAYVYDSMLDSSFLLNVSKRQPVPGAPPEILRETFRFKKLNGSWILDLVSVA